MIALFSLRADLIRLGWGPIGLARADRLGERNRQAGAAQLAQARRRIRFDDCNVACLNGQAEAAAVSAMPSGSRHRIMRTIKHRTVRGLFRSWSNPTPFPHVDITPVVHAGTAGDASAWHSRRTGPPCGGPGWSCAPPI
jgi:hypothetical protein